MCILGAPMCSLALNAFQDVIDGSSNKSGKKLFPTPYGADVLRYWVASTDFSNDVSVGPTVMATVSEALRKIRNTCRFLLASLHGLSDRERAAIQLLCESGSSTGSKDALQTLWSSSPGQLWTREGLQSLTPLDRYACIYCVDEQH